MSNKTRLANLVDKITAMGGLDSSTYDRLMHELDRKIKPIGYDDQGRLKVAMFDAKSYDLTSFEKENNNRFNVIPISAGLKASSAELARECKVVCIFVNDKCDAACVKALAANGVELIALRCAGFNNVDLKACAEYDIDVVRVPSYSPYAIAEHTIALMLMLNRQLHRAYLRNRAGQFIIDGLVGFDMRGKTVGVIGTGNIGRCLINIIDGFGCNVLAYDKFPNEELQSRINLEYTDLDSLQSQSDIITLHTPLLPDTHHIIDKSAIAKMKDGVMLINTSRGGLVDAVALIEGLKSGKIGSAGLDVYEEEADIFFRDISGEVLNDDVFARLLSFNNVVVTSHQAFLTKEALSNIANTTLMNIEEFSQGKRGEALTNKLVF